jgi:hypothetical protein
MRSERYIPIIKTTDAEIKGYQKLSDHVKKSILPLFELTRSRPVKGFPSGDIHRRMAQLREYTNGNPFILDITKHEDLSNPQIDALLDDTNGFQEWRVFLDRYSDLQVIPMLHLYPDDLENFKLFVELTSKKFKAYAFRIGLETTAEELDIYLEELTKVLDVKDRLIVVIDAEYVHEKNIDESKIDISSLVDKCLARSIKHISVNSSSFPSSVKSRIGGGDKEGVMKILELDLFQYLNLKHDSRVIFYGDYAGIHPIRLTIAGGNWVPRVDQTTNDDYIYKRFRRDDGGYVTAAREIVVWNKFLKIDCWGYDQIIKASEGLPEGKSPAFWISVRLNQHITMMSLKFSPV